MRAHTQAHTDSSLLRLHLMDQCSRTKPHGGGKIKIYSSVSTKKKVSPVSGQGNSERVNDSENQRSRIDLTCSAVRHH